MNEIATLLKPCPSGILPGVLEYDLKLSWPDGWQVTAKVCRQDAGNTRWFTE